MRSLHGRALRSGLGVVTFVVLSTAGACTPPEPEDIDLGSVSLRVWQPKVLASGQGDLLEDAERVSITAVIDGQDESLSLEDLRARGVSAHAEGSDVRLTLHTVGSALPDALGRSGEVRLEPGGGELSVTALLAPPDVEHLLSDSLPNPRAAMATCASASGRVWAVGGLFAGTLAAGSFLIDPIARKVTEGPGLPEQRAYAGCVPDESGGVYLAGGCDAAGAAVDGLVHSAGGDLSSPFVAVDPLLGAGCHTRLTRTSAGNIVALTTTRLFVYSPESDEMASSSVGARRAGLLAAFPGDERVLVSGGFSDEALTLPVAGSVVYRLEDGAVADEIALPRRFTAITADADGIVGVDGADIVRALPDGGSEVLLSGVVTAAFGPTRIAALPDGRFALLSKDGASVRVVGDGSPKTLTLDVPRPGASLHADPGGALLLLGGDVAGVSLFVVQ